MKKMNTKAVIQTFVASLAALLLCMACNPGNGNEYFDTTGQISIDGSGQQKAIIAISADCAWTFSDIPTWMTLSLQEGTGNATVEVTCQPNPSAIEPRTGRLTVTTGSGEIRRLVTITQGVSTEEMSVNVEELSFTPEGGSKTISIHSNASWTISGLEDWFALSAESGTGNKEVSLTVQPNTQEVERTAMLVVQGSSTTHLYNVGVRQTAVHRTLEVAPAEITVGSAEGSYNISLVGDAMWYAVSNALWCAINRLEGSGSGIIEATISSNGTKDTRETDIIITNRSDNSKLVCHVTQLGDNANPPTLSALTVTDRQKYSFTATATYASEYDVTECGLCYSATNAMPTIADSKAAVTPAGKQGTITQTVSGLESGKKYYVRAYAISNIGTSYSPAVEVTTIGNMPQEEDVITPQV